MLPDHHTKVSTLNLPGYCLNIMHPGEASGGTTTTAIYRI
jgi:hypothetical protein